MVYKSKVDLWLALFVGGALAFAVIAGFTDAIQTREWAGGVVPVVAILFLRAIAWPASYEFQDDEFIVHSGLLRWKIPWKDIRGIEPSRELWSSPAWSLDRLKVKYGKRSWVLISPERREDFLEDFRRHVKMGGGTM